MPALSQDDVVAVGQLLDYLAKLTAWSKTAWVLCRTDAAAKANP